MKAKDLALGLLRAIEGRGFDAGVNSPEFEVLDAVSPGLAQLVYDAANALDDDVDANTDEEVAQIQVHPDADKEVVLPRPSAGRLADDLTQD